VAMNEETRKAVEELLKNADPALIEKYGNPLDENDPRTWSPSKRAEKGLSLEDQVKFLGLDLESMSMLAAKMYQELGVLREWVLEQQKKEFVALVKEDPEKAVEQLMSMLGGTDAVKGAYGPLDPADPNSPVRYAGSTEGGAPTQMIDTPQGMISIKDIPGYVDDPNWRPSPDWVDANCMCPTHVQMREANNGTTPGDDFPGLYL
jgi:hypothetical protein